MARTRKITTPDGQQHTATVMPFRTSSEHFNEYLLDDQTIVRLKIVVTEVLRIDGQYDPLGNPLYVLSSTNVTSVDAPDELRRKDS